MPLPPVILASASPRRAQLLRSMNMAFEVIPSGAKEVHDPTQSAELVCQINATRKAESVAREHENAIVIGADTIVWRGEAHLGKPKTMLEAERMLASLQGHTHRVATAVCLVHRDRDMKVTFFEVTKVTFRRLNSEQIRRYLDTIDPLDKAGAYAIQENGDWIIQGIEGSYSNVMGLPVERLARAWPAFLSQTDHEEY